MFIKQDSQKRIVLETNLHQGPKKKKVLFMNFASIVSSFLNKNKNETNPFKYSGTEPQNLPRLDPRKHKSQIKVTWETTNTQPHNKALEMEI